jgi:hypothetical protein
VKCIEVKCIEMKGRNVVMERAKRLFWLCLTAVMAFAFLTGQVFVVPAHAAVPVKGNVAVVVRGAKPHYEDAAEAYVLEALIARGYKPVDEKKMAQIRRAKAMFFAAEDNVAAIKRLSAQYGIGTLITVTVEANQRKDPIAGYDGNTSMTAKVATSGGKYIYAGGSNARKVSRTPEDALSSSIEAAAIGLVDDMMK